MKLLKGRMQAALLIFVILLPVFSILITVSPVFGSWWNSEWLFRKQLTIDHTKVAGTLTNFPVLIDITDSDVAGNAQANGNDIVFTDGLDNKLNHEIELYSAASGHLVAWVNVNLSSSSDTSLYMYYGNPSAVSQENSSAVWDTGYKMVQHLSETSGTHYDSTANGNNGTCSGGVGQGVSGKIDGADSFSGTNVFVSFPSTPSLEITDAITFEAWIRPNSFPTYYSNLLMKTGTTDTYIPYQFYLTASTGVLSFWSKLTPSGASSVAVTAGVWQRVAVSVDNSTNTARFYINGSLVATKTANLGALYDSGIVKLAATNNSGASYNNFNGMIDELRISRSIRSNEWISTEYNNENNPSAFYSIGSQETSAQAPVVSNPSPANTATNVPVTTTQLSFQVRDYQSDPMNYTATTSPNVGTGTGTNVGDGTYNVVVSGLDYSTLYTWFVNVTDGTNWTNKTYQFTTGGAVTISLVSPANGATTFDNMPDLVFNATHLTQPTLTCTVWMQSTSGGAATPYNTYTNISSGAISTMPTNATLPNDTYYWWITATDGGGVSESAKRAITINVFRGQKSFVSSYDGSTQYYWLDMPDNFDNSTAVPLVAYLHGYGQNENAYWTEFPVLRQIFQNHTWMVFCPRGRTVSGYHMWYYEAGRIDIMDTIMALNSTYRIDGSRMYVMGRSMGGGGSLKMTMFYPEVFAALCDIHGIANFTQFYVETTSSTYKTSMEVAYGGTPSAVPQVYANESATGNEARFKNKAVMIIHGTADEQVNVNQSQILNRTLTEAGVTVNYIEVLGGPHNPPSVVWGREMAIFEWFRDHPLDLGNPKITQNSPPDNYWSTVYPTNIVFNCTAKSTSSDPYIMNMSLYITDPDNQNFYLYQTNILSGENTTTWTVLLGQGTYTWNCLAYDRAGLSGWGINRTLLLGPDGEAPIWNPTPTNQTVHYNTAFSYDVNATDNVAIDRYFIDDNVNFTINSSTGLIQNNTLLTAGTHKLVISVNDTSGNVNSTTIYVDVVPPALWYDSGWQYRKAITINHSMVAGNLTAFPMLIQYTDADLQRAQSDGDDILFTDYYGARLNHEIERFSNNTGELVAWVNVPELSSTTDTIIYVYYGNQLASNQQNPTGVWNSDFKMVEHLNETSGTQYDSTGNGNNGTPMGGMDQGVQGKIGGADSFDGSNDVVNITSAPAIGITDRLTFEAWLKPNSLPGASYQSIFIKGVDPYVPYQIYLTATTGRLNYYYSMNNIVASGISVTPGTWQHIAVTVDTATTTARFYINGVLVATNTTCSLNSDNGTYALLGGFSTANYFNGMIDEVRVSRYVRSGEWILTEFNNQNQSSTFYSLGLEETQTGEPIVYNPNPAHGAQDVPITLTQLKFSLLDMQSDLMNYTVTTSPNIGSGSGTNVGNGNYTVNVVGLNSLTTYSWTVRATDGNSWSNKTYTFKTELASMIDPYLSGWTYRKAITIDHTKVAADLANFPVLINIIDADLMTKAQVDGDDILFMSASGTALRLNHEIEYYNFTDGRLVAWVRIPALSSTTETVIYMYYGNPTAPSMQNATGVWDAGYKMVQHLDESSGTLYDSTSYGNNAVGRGGVIQGSSGRIDGAINVKPPEQYANGTSFSLADQYTLQLWFKPNNITVGGWQTVFEMGASAGNRLMMWLNGGEFGALGHRDGTYTVSTNANLNASQWCLAVFVFNYSASPQARLYVNGVEVSLTNNNGIGHTPTFTGSFRIGSDTYQIPDYTFNGTIDEVRLSITARTAAWVATEYNNEANPSTFYGIGPEQSAGPRIYISPETTEKTSSDAYKTFKVNVTIENMEDLQAFDFNITWDNSLISLAEIHYNTTLDGLWGAGNWFLAHIQNGTGYCQLAAVSTAASYTGVPPKALATLEFWVRNVPGETAIHFSIVKMSDSKMGSISASRTDGTYRFTGSQYRPNIQNSPVSVTCRKYHEIFSVQLNVTNAVNMNTFNFTVYYNASLMDYTSVTWGELGTGTMTVIDEINGILSGYVSGSSISGNRWMLNITFQSNQTMLWKDGQINTLGGRMWIHHAELSFIEGSKLQYFESGLKEMDVNEVAYVFAPIRGDINNDGTVDITDLRTVAAYYDKTSSSPEWPTASKYDLNLDNIIDLFDLVIVASNYGYTYP